MAIDLTELGITQAELQDRVVERICDRMLEERGFDEDGNEAPTRSTFSTAVQELVKKQLNRSITELAEKHILPNVAQYVENLTLQETNKWGEKTGKTMTFIEYLTQRADAYLREEVNYEGKTKEENGSYSFSKSATRITHLVHKHLHHTIETAMKEAVKNANSVIVEGIQETVKIKLEEIAKKLKFQVTT